MNPSDKRQISSADRLAKKIDKLYQLLIREVGRLSTEIKDFDSEKPFDFNKYPKIKKQIDKLLKEFSENAIDIINQATEQEWNEAVKKNNSIITPYLQRKLLTKEQIAAYTHRNTEALRAFQERKTDGLDLSDRIWKYTNQFRNEIEMSLDLGLSDGRSAQQISRDIRQYLNEPNLLFRRVRDKHGNLHLSKRAKDYNPGKGIYRSSYKNAMRVARTEVNMAYRASDMEKYQQLDFVLGYEVKRSNRVFGCSVCESLKGKYPKDFVFLGWHPQCRCYTVPILQKVDDFIKELQGEDTKKEYITDVPDNFKQWVSDNKDRIDNAQSLPLFLKDNKVHLENTQKQIISNNSAHRFKGEDKKIVESSFVMNNTVEQNLLSRGYELNDLKHNIFNDNFKGLNLLKIDDAINEYTKELELTDLKKTIYMIGNDYVGIKVSNPYFEIDRAFVNRDNEKKAYHLHLIIPEDKQGNGSTKRFFQKMIKEYQNADIEFVELTANIEVGGYAWARYNFYAHKRSDIIEIEDRARKLSYEHKKMFNAWIKQGVEQDYFNMRDLSEMPFGKDLLMGSQWQGYLNLKDKEQMNEFIKYLFK